MHHSEEQDQSSAAADQREQGATDSSGIGAKPQQGDDLLDWDIVEDPGVSHVPSYGAHHCSATAHASSQLL